MSTHADAWYDTIADRGELTRRQLLVWAGDRVAGGAPVFVEAVRWYLDGPLDAARFARAFATTVAGADALRTTIEDDDGWPRRHETATATTAVELVDLARHAAPARALDELGEARIEACAAGAPLVAGALARLGPERHVLVLAQHQLVSDAWSFGVLHRRLVAQYAREADATAWPQFAAYVAFERAYRRSPAAAEARRHWERAHAGCRPASDAPGLGASRTDATRVRRIVVPLGRARSAAVRRRAAEHAASDVGLFVFFAAAVAAHVRRATGGEDVLLDVPFANRPSARFKETLGTFMNVCPVRIEVGGRDRFRDLRARLAAATWEAARHQTFTGHGGGVPQPWDVLVNVHRPSVAAASFDACAMRVEWMAPTHRFGAVAVAVHDFGATGELTLALDLNVGVFSPGERAAFAAALLRLVDEQLLDSERRLDDVDRAAADGAPADAPGSPRPTVWSRFAAQVRATPDAVAVRCGDARTTYARLWQDAVLAARRLAAAGAGRDTVVAVWGARGLGWVRALLGVLGAGAVYVPLDPSWPAARLAEVLRRSRARLVVADGAPLDLVWRLASTDATWTALHLDEVASAAPAAPAPAAPPGPEAGDVAYVLYTSGSTGTPKGALVEHAGLLNHLDAKIGLLALAPGDRVAQTANAGFDVSLWQCLAPLLAGAEVDVLADEVVRDAAALVRVATERRVTVLELVPAVLGLALDAAEEARDGDPDRSIPFGSLRVLVATGEALPPELCRRWFAFRPGVPLVNAYGPTECADDVTHHVLHAALPPGVARVPIGRPIPGMRVYVLDAALRPVPDGEAGELCIAGIGVARGYLDDPERTAAAFVTCALGPGGRGERVYRTGDRGRRLPDGTLEWLGRLDAQVKIRGVRVEPAEVEATLGAHPDVRQVAVVARAEGDAPAQLVAYVVLADGGETAGGAVRVDPAAEAARVREWQRLWDDTYTRESPAARDPAFDTAGWQSRYTRRPIPDDEMREWLDGTVDRIRALAPRRVLEIGCGSGMVLARLAPSCRRWLATDLSAAAVAWVRRRHLAGGRAPHVAVERCAAHELAQFRLGFRPDVVLLNSVTQYFPSLAYLRDVLRAAWAMLAEGGAVFVGDVRSLPLLRALHTSVELARAPDACTVEELRGHVARSLAHENELVIDPGFFVAVARTHGGVVDVQLRRGRLHGELTRFRYDVVWRHGLPAEDAAPVVLDWSAGRPTLAELAALVAARPGVTVTVRGVPNPRVQSETAAAALLAAAPPDTLVGELRRAIAAHPLERGLDPEDVWTSSLAASHDVVVGWSDAGTDRYDVRLRPRRCAAARRERMPEVRAAGGRAAVAAPAADAAMHANDPCRGVTVAARIDALRAFARARLPEAMVPALFVAVPALPLTASGKVDSAALAARAPGRPADAGAPPASVLERTVAGIWSRLLGVPVVHRDDEFFALGGDSLLVYRLLRALRTEIGIELDVETFLARPTVAGTAAALATVEVAEAADDSGETEALLRDVEALADDEVAALLVEGAGGEGADA